MQPDTNYQLAMNPEVTALIEEAVKAERSLIGEMFTYWLERNFDLTDSLRKVATTTKQERIDRELAIGKEASANLYVQMGKTPGYQYRGGPVDWETGLPARSACAWTRKRQSTNTSKGEKQ